MSTTRNVVDHAADHLAIRSLLDRYTDPLACSSSRHAGAMLAPWVEAESAPPLVRDFGEPGEHVLTALADSGAWTRLRFRVLE